MQLVDLVTEIDGRHDGVVVLAVGCQATLVEGFDFALNWKGTTGATWMDEYRIYVISWYCMIS